MIDNLRDIKIGTILVSNTLWGMDVCQVADVFENRWGTHLSCVQNGEFITVSTVGNCDMLGVGWKLATDSELKRAMRNRESTASAS